MKLRGNIFGSTRMDDSQVDESRMLNIRNCYKNSKANKGAPCQEDQ